MQNSISEDPLDNEELLQDQLDSLPYLCRFQVLSFLKKKTIFQVLYIRCIDFFNFYFGGRFDKMKITVYVV